MAVLVVALVAAAIVGAAAYGFDEARTPRARASVVLSVPVSTAAESPTSDPQGASQLAATYVQLLSLDDALLRRVAGVTSTSTTTTDRRLSFRRRGTDSALIDITFGASSSSRARRGMNAVRAYLRTASSRASGLYGQDTFRAIGSTRVRARTASGLYRRTSSYLVVPTQPTTTPDAQLATRLAQTYAGLIGQDIDILTSASRRTGLPVGDVADHLSVSNQSSTPTVQVSYAGTSYAQARSVVLAVSQAVTGAAPVSRRISPSTLQLTRPPASSVPVAADRSLAVGLIGAVIGFVLGLLGALAYRNRHPRFESAEAAREAFGLPVTRLSTLDDEALSRLARRWDSERPQQVALVAGRPDRLADARTVARALEVGNRRPVQVAAPSEVAADFIVLLVEPGASFEAVRSTISAMEGRGASVRWLLLRDGAPPLDGGEVRAGDVSPAHA